MNNSLLWLEVVSKQKGFCERWNNKKMYNNNTKVSKQQFTHLFNFNHMWLVNTFITHNLAISTKIIKRFEIGEVNIHLREVCYNSIWQWENVGSNSVTFKSLKNILYCCKNHVLTVHLSPKNQSYFVHYYSEFFENMIVRDFTAREMQRKIF